MLRELPSFSEKASAIYGIAPLRRTFIVVNLVDPFGLTELEKRLFQNNLVHRVPDNNSCATAVGDFFASHSWKFEGVVPKSVFPKLDK